MSFKRSLEVRSISLKPSLAPNTTPPNNEPNHSTSIPHHIHSNTLNIINFPKKRNIFPPLIKKKNPNRSLPTLKSKKKKSLLSKPLPPLKLIERRSKTIPSLMVYISGNENDFKNDIPQKTEEYKYEDKNLLQRMSFHNRNYSVPETKSVSPPMKPLPALKPRASTPSPTKITLKQSMNLSLDTSKFHRQSPKKYNNDDTSDDSSSSSSSDDGPLPMQHPPHHRYMKSFVIQKMSRRNRCGSRRTSSAFNIYEEKKEDLPIVPKSARLLNSPQVFGFSGISMQPLSLSVAQSMGTSATERSNVRSRRKNSREHKHDMLHKHRYSYHTKSRSTQNLTDWHLSNSPKKPRKYSSERKKSRKKRTDSELKFNWIKGDVIGKGAFGIVYKAFDKTTGEIIAVKEISLISKKHKKFSPRKGRKKNKNKQMQKILKEFDHETKLMKCLKHRNIVQFKSYVYDSKEKKVYITMEYVAGNSLAFIYNKNGAFAESMIKNYVRQILKGLEYAHEQNIIHRDIKGGNILINNQNVIKLADFGSAILTAHGKKENAFQMDFEATPLWTAPEVLVTGKYDSKIDIWSVGCVIIEMATAKKPWSEYSFDNSFAALFHIGQSNERPKWPTNCLSLKCQNFLDLCLKRDPEQRLSAKQLLSHEFILPFSV